MIHFICMHNRVGSHWLCDMIQSTGVGGYVGELPDKVDPGPVFLDYWSKYNPLIVKLNTQTMIRIHDLINSDEQSTAKYVYLYRSDKLRQAISQYRAEQDGIWHVEIGQDIPRKHLEVKFDKEAILDLKRRFRRYNRMWLRWFDEHSVYPMMISYDQLCRNPVRATLAVVDYFGLRARQPVNAEGYRILSDEITERWYNKLSGGSSYAHKDHP